MQIVLATSPHVRHPAVLQSDFTPDQASMYSFAPVGLLALSAVLRSDVSVEPVLFDINQQIVTGAIPLDTAFYRSAAERICEHRPDLLGFMTECDSYHHVLQVLAQVKRMRPDCCCVLGGPHASAVARQTMERHPYVDAIVIGEGERTLPDLVKACAEGYPGPIMGTLRRDSSSNLIDGGPRPLVPNLDELPMPAFDLYRGTPEEEMFIEAGRGCPFQCTFCSTAPFWQRRHRVKSPARILEEIQLVQRLFQSRRVHFTHDLLTTDKLWVADLCRVLFEAGVPVKWTCSARTDTVDRALLEQMARAGCNAIYFGIESGSARILREIKKDVPLTESLDVLQTCLDLGIRPNAGFIAGFPTEDRTSLHETFDAFERSLAMGTRPAHIFGFCPFASSSLYAHLENLTCDGHFLDIPIEPELDAANRALVASDPDLFGSYFRPAANVGSSRLQGVDEFSCLVEPIALPALELARHVGGMLGLYDRWTAWIEQRNLAVGASAHRRFYGSPLSFCEFVLEQLEAIEASNAAMVQLAKVMRTNFDVARRWSSALPTTMATHRSIGPLDVGPLVQLGDQLRLSTIVALLRLDYDVVPLINAVPGSTAAPVLRPTYLLWYRSDDGAAHMSQVDPFLFAAIEQLQRGPKPVAALMVDWAQGDDHPADFDRLMHVLTEARTMRIVETV